MRTIWLVLAGYAVLFALTAVITGDSSVIIAGLLVGLLILGAATAVTVAGRRTRAGDRSAGSRGGTGA